ncbi:MAG: hypothetical protein ACRDG7_10315, partial [Candidatus Limnocylindria bacterium]
LVFLGAGVAALTMLSLVANSWRSLPALFGQTVGNTRLLADGNRYDQAGYLLTADGALAAPPSLAAWLATVLIAVAINDVIVCGLFMLIRGGVRRARRRSL